MLLRRASQHIRRQDWTAITIEFVLLIAGILIALQVAEWNESRRERIREHDYLVRMLTELDQSIRDIENAIALSVRRRQLGEFLMQSIHRPEMVRAEPGTFVMAIPQSGYTFTPKVRSLAFDEARSAGDLDVFQDKDLLFDIAEFHAEVEKVGQWDYLRATKQAEYTERSAGILDYAEIVTTNATPSLDTPVIDVAVAMAAHARMLERPDFIEWLPTVTDRGDEIAGSQALLETAKDLRARIHAKTAGGAP
jgi:hypothetical protein